MFEFQIVHRLILYFGSFLFSCALIAVEPSTRFNRLSIHDGLPQSSVSAFLVDSQGFLWVGTSEGLARYDGYSFKVFKAINENVKSISGNFVLTMIEDKEGVFWIGNNGGGLTRFNPETETFRYYRSNPAIPGSLSNNNVLAITEGNDGNLWVGTEKGLNHFNRKTETFSYYLHDPLVPNSLSHDYVRALTVDNQGILWIGTWGGGLNRFNSKTENFNHYRFDDKNVNGLNDDFINVMTKDEQGNLWLGTLRGGLSFYDLKTDRFTNYRLNSNKVDSLTNNDVRAIKTDSRGKLWVGTFAGGLNVFDPTTQKFTNYRSDSTDQNSVSADSINDIAEDKNGNIWISTNSDGLNLFNPDTQKFNNYRYNIRDPNSLSTDSVNAISEDKNGYLWVGTDKGGLNRFNPKTKSFRHFRYDANNPNSLSNDFILAITEDSMGNLWVGTKAGGLNLFDSKKQSFIHYRFEISILNGLSDANVKTITEDIQGNLWIGTSGGGIYNFSPKMNKFKSYRFKASNENSLSNDYVHAVLAGRQGEIWIGTRGGLDRLDPSKNNFIHYRFDDKDNDSLSHDEVTSILEDNSGNLWVGTYGGGLNQLNTKSNKFTRYRRKDGLPSDVIYRIEEDNNGFLWISTNNGLSRFHPKTGLFRNYTVEDGLQHYDFNGGSSYKNTQGELFFGGLGGFNRFFPEQITDDTHPPTVVITELLLNNKSVDINPLHSDISKKQHTINQPTKLQKSFVLNKAIHLTDAITLSHEDNIVAFEFSALHFTNPKKNKYAYQLVGWDKGWVSTDYKNRRATYTNLPRGDYTFRVKASNDDGYWNEEGASLNVMVLPPPWKTWWAYTFYALLLATMLILFIRRQQKKVLLERNLSAELELQVANRTKELQEAYTLLEEVSLTDHLTGLKNRRFLLNNINNDTELVIRKYRKWIDGKFIDKPELSDLIFFLIDLDHFKQVNDIHGHTAGDAVLVEIKNILEKVFRETDYLVRWGGEEFLVVARFTDRKNAPDLAERLRKAVEEHSFDIGHGNSLNKTCSIGYASYPFLIEQPNRLDWERVVDIADHCLYAAKKSNRNAWIGLENINCIEDNIFTNITEKTQHLVEVRQVDVLSSIVDKSVIRWD